MSIDNSGGLPVRPTNHPPPPPPPPQQQMYPAASTPMAAPAPMPPQAMQAAPQPPAPQPPTPQPPPTQLPQAAPAPPHGDAHIEALARTIAATLAEHDVLLMKDPSTEVEARQVLDELARLRASAPVANAALKEQRWEVVVSARAAYKQLLDGSVGAPPPASVHPSHLADAELLQRDFELAEQKARRAMAGPGAFKKFALSRRELESFLSRFGVSTIEQLRQLATAGPAPAVQQPQSLQEATDAVAAAEAAWMAVNDLDSQGLPATPEIDGLRVRAYRLIGMVVDDNQIEPQLRLLADRTIAMGQIRSRLITALQGIGVTDGDPISNARAISQQLHAG